MIVARLHLTALAAAATAALLALQLTVAVPRAAAAATSGTCATAQTQLAMNTCWGAAANASDHQVSVAYAHLLAKATGSQRTLVIAAQNAWKTYRDTECKAAGATYAGGSIQPMEISICRDRLNRARVVDLKSDADTP
ncbi:MAG TPA: lysozyme inhibitor LprI family protein [Candidatus Elarobacter sp.]|nr:lysozyme inhibitor LprI family protein [Candidatus Elarobacter sp.]